MELTVRGGGTLRQGALADSPIRLRLSAPPCVLPAKSGRARSAP